MQTLQLVLRPMEGVAHATGSETAKEIHFSCDYIADSADRCADEIRGVLVHEVVHCIQYNGKDTCPSGLIEGIAGASIRPLPGFGTPLRRTYLQIGSVFVPVWRPRTGVERGIAGMRAMMARHIFCSG